MFFRFIGVKKTGGVREVQETMNEVCYDEVLSYVKRGLQVLVSAVIFFVIIL